MRYAVSILALFLLILLSSHATSAQDVNTGGYDDVDIYISHDVEHHFYEAMIDFEKKDLKSAADEIRKSAAFLKLEAYRTPGGGDEAIMASAKELAELADGVEDEDVTSGKEVQDTFARAHYALSTHHFAGAKENWSRKDAKNTGLALKMALLHLEHASAWAGHRGEAFVVTIAGDTVAVAEKLVEGGAWVAKEVETAIDALGKEIERFGKLLKSDGK